MSSAEIIKAAGGIIERYTKQGIEIALIHRTRYGSEWCLPKGKLDNEEGWEDAALREVREETGLNCSIVGIVGTISYYVKDIPKIVLFFRMSVKENMGFIPTEEVDKVEWISPAEAFDQLSHTEEIELLKRTYEMERPEAPAESFNRLLTTARTVFQARRKGRLTSDITVYRQELHRRSLLNDLSSEASLAVRESCKLIKLAERAVLYGDIDRGWKCLNGAKRMELFSYSDTKELAFKALALREEASKLSPWRKKAIDSLLGPSSNPKEIKDVATIYEAAQIRDEHFSNEAYKSSLKRDYNFSLIVLLAIIIISIFSMLKNNIIVLSDSADYYGWEMIVSVAIFGLLGGVVSAITREMDIANKPSKIPEVVTAIRVTLLRVFIGSAFALVIYLFMRSEITQIFDKEIATSLQTANSFTIYAVSFVAGYTERLVLRAVEVVAGKSEK